MKILAKNKKQLRNYKIEKKFEAGIALLGSEVKSIRDKKVQFTDSTYVQITKNLEAFLINLNVEKNLNSSYNNHDIKRPRKMLLHKKEIKNLMQESKLKGLTIIPSIIYLNNNLIKVEICLAKGIKKYDKREKEKEKDFKRLVKKYQ